MGFWNRTNRALDDAQRHRRPIRPDLWCEPLESRRLLSTVASASELSEITAQTSFDVISAVSTGPTGLTPQEIRSAYEIDLISFSGGTVSGTGAGETIAIVDAYNDPNIASDLAEFDAEFDLPAPPSYTVDNLGATTTSAGWALETALDVEWAHAIAPGANIILVEATSSSLNSLFNAVAYAAKQAGVSVVSMSWGASEFRGESSYDSLFTTPAGHAGVTFVAASGDTGTSGGPEYPSVSPNVLAVGGTTLTLTSDGTYGSESGWRGSTGGFSGTDSGFRWYESEPSYQTSTLESVGLSDGVRTTPDVSFDADPSSGVSVHDSVAYDGQAGWFEVGGTSLAAPAWAGLIAIVDQGLATGGKSSLTTAEVLTDLYSLPSSDFNDVATGDNGYGATEGYDLVTGLGTPRASSLVAGVLAENGVSETAASITSSATSTSPTATTTSKSPHKVKPKHIKAVIKKHRKAGHKAAAADSVAETAASGSNSQGRTRLSEATSITGSLLTADGTSTTAIQVGPLASSLPSLADTASPARPIHGSHSDQVEAIESARRKEPSKAKSNDSARDEQPVGHLEEIEPMTELTDVSYVPVLTDDPSGLIPPSITAPEHAEFDEALAQVAASSIRRTLRAAQALTPGSKTIDKSSADSMLSAGTGVGAIAAAAYRLLLSPPNDPKRQPVWYSRFPKG